MLVKKVSSNEKHHPQNAVETSHKEVLLETVNSSQDQTIQELLRQLDSVLAMKVILSFPLPHVSVFICFFIVHHKHGCLL
jgi:hypothetical protein